jgi:hypothetical protein
MVAGARPKPEGQALNRVQKVVPWTDVPNVPNRRGPRLPQRAADGARWHRAVVRKWQAWKSMPQAALWSAAEWEHALDSIELAQRFYLGDTRAAVELRSRERAMGTTLDARIGLRIRYVEPAVQQLAVVAPIEDYRDL